MKEIKEIRLREIIADALNLEVEDVNDKLEYNSNPFWDSLGQINLTVGLEAELGIDIEPHDEMVMNTYPRIKQVLKNEYSINIV